MTEDVKKYFEEKYANSKIKVVTGHWPDFKTNLEVDEWMASKEQISNFIDYYFPNK